MPAPLINFPLSSIVDGILSFLQWSFKNIEITPSEYRWDPDDRKSLIRISAPFVVDNQKPMSAPFIVVERGPYQFANRAIDNLKSGQANVMDSMTKVDWMDGTINIICGSGSSGEASSMANFIAMLLQGNRHGIKGILKFVRSIYYLDVSPEIPIVKDTEVRRWEVTLRIFTSLQIGWIETQTGDTPWNKASVKSIRPSPLTTSNKGQITVGSDLLVDMTRDFGPFVANNPQLLEQELAKQWYHVRMPELTTSAYLDTALFTVVEVVDNHTLRLQYHDVNNQPVPWVAPESKIDFSYELLWNDLHISMEFPKP